MTDLEIRTSRLTNASTALRLAAGTPPMVQCVAVHEFGSSAVSLALDSVDATLSAAVRALSAAATNAANSALAIDRSFDESDGTIRRALAS